LTIQTLDSEHICQSLATSLESQEQKIPKTIGGEFFLLSSQFSQIEE